MSEINPFHQSTAGKFPPVQVEYDSRKGRDRKTFDSPFQARQFFAKKLKEGKNPKVLKSAE